MSENIDLEIEYLNTPISKSGYFVKLLNDEVSLTRDRIEEILAKEFEKRLIRLMAFIEEPVAP